MANDLRGKQALVTGASSGIGAVSGRLCTARGADVIVTARRAENLDALAKELGAKHAEFHKAAGHEASAMVLSTGMSADDCARIGLGALFGARRNIVSGLMNKLSIQLLRFMPRRLTVWMAALTMGVPKLPEAKKGSL